jgi:hypothetical protein
LTSNHTVLNKPPSHHQILFCHSVAFSYDILCCIVAPIIQIALHLSNDQYVTGSRNKVWF